MIKKIFSEAFAMWPTWKQWASWTLPSKASFLGLIIGIIGVVLTVVFWLIPSFDRLFPQAPIVVPSIAVHLQNSGPTKVFVGTRGLVWLWYPSDRYTTETYEAQPVDHRQLQNGLIEVMPHRDTLVAVTLMNPKRLIPLMQAGDLDLTIYFRRANGSLFSSKELLPFKKQALEKFYVTADANPTSK